MKTILITGVSSGVGLACANALLNAGYGIVGLSRTKPDIQDASFTWLKLDLSKVDQVAEFCKHRLPTLDIDCLLYCAGVGHFGYLEQLNAENFAADMQVNCFSAMQLSKALLPHMKQQKSGQFIFIGSEAALKGAKQGSLYCATKFALRGFVQSLAEELRRYAIPVTLINPGLLKTAFHDSVHFQPAAQPQSVIDLDMIVDTIQLLIKHKAHGFAAEIELKPFVNQVQFKS